MITLRNLLVQDWDLDEDGKPDTLRLLFGAPRRWLEDGKRIDVEHAPTQFGPVSCRVTSKLGDGYITVHFLPPPRAPKTVMLRAPLPEGWDVASVQIDGRTAPLMDGNTVELTGGTAPLEVTFTVKTSK
jgi:hypothetical protein